MDPNEKEKQEAVQKFLFVVSEQISEGLEELCNLNNIDYDLVREWFYEMGLSL